MVETSQESKFQAINIFKLHQQDTSQKWQLKEEPIG